MTKMSKQKVRLWWRVGLGTALVCAVVLALPTSSLMSASGDPTVSVQPSLNPDKASWESMVASEQAAASSAWADPAISASAQSAMAAWSSTMASMNGKPHEQQDIRAMCPERPVYGQGPISTQVFRSTSDGLQRVIHGQCVDVYVGVAGYDNQGDGAVFAVFFTVDGDGSSHLWTFPGTGALSLTKLTDGGIATLQPTDGGPFDLDVTKF